MKKKLLCMLLAAAVAISLFPMTAMATPEEAVASIGDTMYTSLGDALAAAKPNETVVLLKDITGSADNITVPELAILDLNNHVLKTTGTVENNGAISLYQENADIIDFLLYNVPGAYGAGEDLKLPNEEAPDYIVPAGAFVTAYGDPAYQQLDFAIGDEPLVWNKDVPAGMQLDVTYKLTLGGDILAPKTPDVFSTEVIANKITLSNDIVIGSNDTEDGGARLYILSIYDEMFGDTIGAFTANGKTITLNRTGELICSSDIEFADSVLIPGEDGMIIDKEEDTVSKLITYRLCEPTPADVIDTLRPSITAPVTGEVPSTVATPEAGANYTAGEVAWNDDPEVFAPSTAYTATVVLIPNENYKFADALDITIDGASTVMFLDNLDGTITVIAEYQLTEPTDPAEPAKEPTQPATPAEQPPKMGDDSTLMLWMTMFGLSAMGIAVLAVTKKERQ